MDWEKEPTINRIARRLPKKAYRQRMTVAEWKGYFEMVYDEALIIHGVGNSVITEPYLISEKENQIEEMKKLGLFTEGILFEQSINGLIQVIKDLKEL